MSDGLIVPKDIPIPKVKPEDLRTAADALEDDGDDISQAGQDIKMSWQGLEGIYDAPESETLFSAINPVATKGDDVDYAVGITVGALRTFANDAERLKTKLQGLKADAKAFVEDVKGDDDWREDEDKVDEHNTLNNDILAALHEYQEAERHCANKITAQFNGTTFVTADPGEKQMLNKREKVYGTAEALEDVETPWAKPQKHDGAWYEDAYDATKDFAVGTGKEALSAIGVYGEDGWATSLDEWAENTDGYWRDTVKGLAGLAGFDGENGWMPDSLDDWGSTFGDGWKAFGKEMVAWDEWDDRPGYAATQSVLNIGSTALGGAGAVKALSKAGRAADGDGADGSNGDSDGSGSDQRPDRQQVGDRPGQQSTQDLQDQFDDMALGENELDGLQDALGDSERLADRVPVGGPDSGPDDFAPVRNGGDSGNGDDGYGYDESGSPPGGSGGRGDGGERPEGDGAPDSGRDTMPDGADPFGPNRRDDGGDGMPDGDGRPEEDPGTTPDGGGPLDPKRLDGDSDGTPDGEAPDGDRNTTPDGSSRDTPASPDDTPHPADPFEQDPEPAGDDDGSADESEAPQDPPDGPGGDEDSADEPPSKKDTKPDFYVDDGTRPARLAIWEVYSHVPQHILDATNAYMREVPGGGISIGDAPLTQLPGGDALPQGRPNGHPEGSSFDDVAGVWEPQSRRLLISTSRGSASTSVPLHEYGHAVDNANGWHSSSEEWDKIQQDTAGALQSKSTYNSYYDSPREWWAESFAAWCKGWDTMVSHALDNKKVAGILWEYFERKMGGS